LFAEESWRERDGGERWKGKGQEGGLAAWLGANNGECVKGWVIMYV